MPTSSQRESFSSWAGTCRFLYNACLEQRILYWTQYKKSINYYDQAAELKNVKKDNDLEWIAKTPAQCLQQTIMDLDKAFKSFWKSGFGFPHFKKKSQGDSFRFPDPAQFSVRVVSRKKAFVKLPKIGEVAFRLSRPLAGKIKYATISKSGVEWMISFCCEKIVPLETEAQTIKRKQLLPVVGIDRGISQTVALSYQNGQSQEELSLPQSCYHLFERLKVLQTRLRLKKKFSKAWRFAQSQISKIHKKITRIRLDFLHKLSSNLAKNHGHIVLEDLKIKNMSKSSSGTLEKPGKNVKAKSGLNRQILFQGWGIFARLLAYKCEWLGHGFELVSPRMTSQRCSHCLFESKENRKGKVFKCQNCGYESDADENAAINILNKSSSQSTAGHAGWACGGVCVSMANEAGTSCSS